MGPVHDKEIRRQLLEIVSEKLIGQQRSVADLLVTADREHAHDLLQILLDVEDPDDLQYAIQVAMENGDAGVRLEAVSLIPLTRLEQYQTILFLALNDLTKSVRSKAIHLLARLTTPSVNRRIIKLIDSARFKDFELDEKEAFSCRGRFDGRRYQLLDGKILSFGSIGDQASGARKALRCHCFGYSTTQSCPSSIRERNQATLQVSARCGSGDVGDSAHRLLARRPNEAALRPLFLWSPHIKDRGASNG